MRFAVLSLAALCLAGGTRARAQAIQTETLTSPADDPAAAFGAAVASVGDVDGDGVPDLLVGAPRSDPDTAPADAGRAFVLSGATGAVLRTLASPTGQAAGHFGASIAGAGDVDGDGVPDLLVGAPGESGSGRAYLVRGATGAVLRALASPEGSAGGAFGAAVAGVGDVDGDGMPDLLVGAPGEGAGGRAYVVSGATGAVLHAVAGASAGGGFGEAVAGVGDVTGDGRPDLAVGAPGDGGGRAYLFSGADGTVWRTLAGPDQPGARFGSALASMGDADGDGRADVAIGAPGEDDGAAAGAGRVYVLSGASGAVLVAHRPPGAAAGDALGTAVALAGDVNGDGVPDVLAGAPGDDGGRAYLLSGSGSALLGVLASPGSDGRFGAAVALAGRLDADASADFIVGAPDDGGSGRVYAASGTSGEMLFTARSPFERNASRFGAAVADLGDVDGDGLSDLAVGAPDATEGPGANGRIYVVSSRDGAPRRTIFPPGDADGFGAILAAAGDVDGDGVTDLVVGAPAASGGIGLDGAGRAHVFSGATGALLATLVSPNVERNGAFGTSVDAAGDLDGDGRGDVLVGAPFEDAGGTNNGHVYAFGGPAGALLRTYVGEGPHSKFGMRVVGTGDVTGDGRPDLLVLSNPSITALVHGLDGASGATRFVQTVGAGSTQGVPSSAFPVVRTGDVTGDGRPDFAVGTRFAFPCQGSTGCGAVTLHDGVSGSAVGRLTSPEPASGGLFGSALARLADVDGDGEAEIAVGASFESPLGTTSRSGVVYLFGETTRALVGVLTAPDATAVGTIGDVLAAVGDADGDGRPDLAVGAPGDGGGQVLVFAGLGRLVPPRYPLLLRRPEPLAYADFGAATASLDDVTGDGRPDVAVAAPFGSTLGRVHVFDGASGAALYRLDGCCAPGFGSSLSSVTDVNGDGAGDLVVGDPMRPGMQNNEGWAYLYSGTTGALLRALRSPNPAQNGRFGTAVVGLSDVSGDGVQDVLVGAPLEGGVGRAHVFSGATGGVLFSVSSPAPEAGGRFGLAVGRARDLDGDGVRDFAVGAPGEGPGASPDGAGRVHLFSAVTGALLRTLASPSERAEGAFGSALDRLGVVAETGAADLAVGAPGETAGGQAEAGQAHLFRGATGALVRTLASPSPQAGGAFGAALAFAADVDRNGTVDLLVGAPREPIGGVGRAGAAHLFDGDTGSVLFTFASPVPGYDARFGTSLAGADGDLDGDNRPDLFVGAPGEGYGGRAYVLVAAALLPVAAEAPPASAPAVAPALRVAPNPSRGAARVEVTLPEAADVTVEVFDPLGRRVAVLADARLPAGTYAFALDARLAAGAYVVRLRAGAAVVARVLTRL